MDPALPPGGLQRIFQQYDAIKTHATRDDGPPWEDQEDQVKAVGSPELTTPAAGGVSNTPPPEAPKEASNTPPPEAPTNAQERPRGRPKAWANNQDERAQQLMEQRMRASHANKLLTDREKNMNGGVSYAQDEAGMAL